MFSNEELAENCADIAQGEFIKAFGYSKSSTILSSSIKALSLSSSDSDILSGNDEERLIVAVSCLQMFVQNNWTGPSTSSVDELASALSLTKQEFEDAERQSQSWLTVDGEPVYERLIYPSLLAISRHILSKATPNKSTSWLKWELRSVYVHQAMIDERCNSLKTEAMQCINSLMDIEGVNNDAGPSSHSKVPNLPPADADWKLMAVGQSRYYFEHKTCKRLLDRAILESGLTVKLDGVPGKRTRYQEKDIAQLVLKVEAGDAEAGSLGNGDSVIESEPSGLPKDEPLHDDTVLDKMRLSEPDPTSDNPAIRTRLSAVEQCLLLAMCEENRYVREANADITEEETSAYLTHILSQPCDWSVQFKSLLTRSLSENGGRRIERSLRQLEELCSLTTHQAPDVTSRLRSVYSSSLPPTWQVQRSFGELEMEVGLYASAMEIFDRLGLWSPLIVCSQRAGRTGKAEELIRSRLRIEETAPLYCSLSDVTGDPQYYHNAWELSNYRSARAMRGLAFHHLRACQYDEAIECFEKTLAINPLQLPCWFSFGCSSLAAGYYDKAATAFRRCVILNEDNFEAWNNLAAAYARNKQKPRAFAVLQDAIKCSFDNWKVWENYTVIGADCGEVSEVIRGAHRILDLTGKWHDDQVVEHLSKMILEDIPDSNNQPSSVHRAAMLKLLGHTTAKVTNSAVLWRCYGRLILAAKDNSIDNTERGIQCLQKGYRCATNSAGWEKIEDKCQLNTDVLLELVEAYKEIGNKKYLSTAKLQIKGHIARLKQGHTDPVTKQINNEVIRTILDSLDSTLTQLPIASD